MGNLFNSHTFKYRGKKYLVKDLINFINNEKISEKTLEVKEFRIFFNNKDMGDVWRFTDGKLLDHYRRIEHADLSYPIIFIRDKNGSIEKILDGWHRLIRIFLNDQKEIKVIELKKEELQKFMKKYEPCKF